MITIEINESRQELTDINPSWINEQIRKREADGVAVCVRIYIKEGNTDLVLSCGDCGTNSGGSSGRKPNSDEQIIFDLWNQFGCDEKPINPGKITAFLNQVK